MSAYQIQWNLLWVTTEPCCRSDCQKPGLFEQYWSPATWSNFDRLFWGVWYRSISNALAWIPRTTAAPMPDKAKITGKSLNITVDPIRYLILGCKFMHDDFEWGQWGQGPWSCSTVSMADPSKDWLRHFRLRVGHTSILFSGPSSIMPLKIESFERPLLLLLVFNYSELSHWPSSSRWWKIGISLVLDMKNF